MGEDSDWKETKEGQSFMRIRESIVQGQLLKCFEAVEVVTSSSKKSVSISVTRKRG